MMVALAAESVFQARLQSGPSAFKPDEARLTKEESKLVQLVNSERAKRGIAALAINTKLMIIARGHSRDMVRVNTLSHTLEGRGPSERASEVGYRYTKIAENVAYNQRTIKDAVRSWIESPGHKANILNRDYRETGVGIVVNKKGEPYYTQVFGRR
jgi:uncharacterized protein YkwD